MVYKKDNAYFRICNDCGNTREIQRQSYIKGLKKDKHFCLSCMQKGKRNHNYKVNPWNKGLNKEIDDRIKNAAIKDAEAKRGQNPWNIGKTYEELMGKSWADNFKNKVSVSKSGIPNYKNRKELSKSKSASYFRKMCRKLLYSEWTSRILKRDNYTCQLCGYKKDLEVHHIRRFSDILYTVAERLNLDLDDYKEFTNDEFNTFREEVIKEHKLEDGITLCRECHKGVDLYRRRFCALHK